jgi:hypothetical protein
MQGREGARQCLSLSLWFLAKLLSSLGKPPNIEPLSDLEPGTMSQPKRHWPCAQEKAGKIDKRVGQL